MFLVVLRSIFKVSKLRLFIPTISALVLQAFSNYFAVCASTSTFTPFLCPYSINSSISDIIFLKSLPKRELICGYGEILKHALIADNKIFKFLNKNGSNILNLKSPLIEKAIFKSCSIKKKVVETDDKEIGMRKILNFGHTFAHAFEATLRYSPKLNHGEAVILGIKTAARFSLLNKILNIEEFKLIENHLSLNILSWENALERCLKRIEINEFL